MLKSFLENQYKVMAVYCEFHRFHTPQCKWNNFKSGAETRLAHTEHGNQNNNHETTAAAHAINPSIWCVEYVLLLHDHHQPTEFFLSFSHSVLISFIIYSPSLDDTLML